jgi:hypothetical protein
VAATVAPRCRASWIANVPTPPEPAWMRIFCPARRPAISTSACHAVRAASGTPAASSIVSRAGLGARSSSPTEMNSANAPIRSLPGRA